MSAEWVGLDGGRAGDALAGKLTGIAEQFIQAPSKGSAIRWAPLAIVATAGGDGRAGVGKGRGHGAGTAPAAMPCAEAHTAVAPHPAAVFNFTCVLGIVPGQITGTICCGMRAVHIL